MSTEILRAILGNEAVDAMTSDEVHALAQSMDEAILQDADLSARLAKVIKEAAEKLQSVAE